MNNFLDFIQNNISIFDFIVFLIILYSMFQCFVKGFLRSLLSFSKWLLALIITIILVPKLNPIVQDFIESKFLTDVGLGIFVYVISLFIIINLGKAINRVITMSGLGGVDKSFGLIFGIFKGYIVCVCIFSLFNWFYPHQKWPLETEDTYSFEIIYKGSEFLIDEFPNSKDYYEETGEKIENI
jgi:membrane protein required for colicin V production